MLVIIMAVRNDDGKKHGVAGIERNPAAGGKKDPASEGAMGDKKPSTKLAELYRRTVTTLGLMFPTQTRGDAGFGSGGLPNELRVIDTSGSVPNPQLTGATPKSTERSEAGSSANNFGFPVDSSELQQRIFSTFRELSEDNPYSVFNEPESDKLRMIVRTVDGDVGTGMTYATVVVKGNVYGTVGAFASNSTVEIRGHVDSSSRPWKKEVDDALEVKKGQHVVIVGDVYGDVGSFMRYSKVIVEGNVVTPP
jgi:hypothetical protein